MYYSIIFDLQKYAKFLKEGLFSDNNFGKGCIVVIVSLPFILYLSFRYLKGYGITA